MTLSRTASLPKALFRVQRRKETKLQELHNRFWNWDDKTNVIKGEAESIRV